MSSPTLSRRTLRVGGKVREFWTLAADGLRIFFLSWEEARRYCKRWGIDPVMED